MYQLKGQGGAGGATVLAIIYVAVMIVIGVLVFYQIVENINSTGTLTTAGNTTLTQVSANANNAFQLLGVAIIVLAAGAIILYLRVFGGTAM